MRKTKTLELIALNSEDELVAQVEGSEGSPILAIVVSGMRNAHLLKRLNLGRTKLYVGFVSERTEGAFQKEATKLLERDGLPRHCVWYTCTTENCVLAHIIRVHKYLHPDEARSIASLGPGGQFSD